GELALPGREPQPPARVAGAVCPAYPPAVKRGEGSGALLEPGRLYLEHPRRARPASPSAAARARRRSRLLRRRGLFDLPRQLLRGALAGGLPPRRGWDGPVGPPGRRRGGPLPVTVLVTGASGFLGRPLVRALLAAGRQVVALARDPAALADLAGPALRILPGDLRDPLSYSPWLVAGVSVFHLAAIRNH